MRKTKLYLPFLLCAFGLAGACGSPVLSQTPPPAPVSNPAPDPHPFESLLQKLDHPPVDFNSLAESRKRSELLRSAAEEYNSTMKPVMPLLKSIASNKDLEKVRYVPVVGDAVGTGQDAVSLAVSMNDAMRNLVKLDQDYVKPLQAAAAVSLKLKKNHSLGDVPEAVSDYAQAAAALGGYSGACKTQAVRLDHYAAFLDKIAGSMPGPKFVSAPVRDAAGGLRSVGAKLTNIQTSLDNQQAFNAACAADGAAAMKKRR